MQDHARSSFLKYFKHFLLLSSTILQQSSLQACFQAICTPKSRCDWQLCIALFDRMLSFVSATMLPSVFLQWRCRRANLLKLARVGSYRCRDVTMAMVWHRVRYTAHMALIFILTLSQPIYCFLMASRTSLHLAADKRDYMALHGTLCLRQRQVLYYASAQEPLPAAVSSVAPFVLIFG